MKQNELNQLWQNYKDRASQDRPLSTQDFHQFLTKRASPSPYRFLLYQSSMYTFLLFMCQTC